MWLIASVSKIENESLVCEQSQQKGWWMVMSGGMVVEGRGPRGGGDPSDYIDRPAEQGEGQKGAGGQAERMAAVWQWQLACGRQLVQTLG